MIQNYYAKRIVMSVFTLFVVITFSFFLIRYMPGGPMDYMIANLQQQGLSTTRARELAATYTQVNPDQPAYIAYVEYMGKILTGNFGTSTVYDKPVIDILITGLPWTLFVMSVSLVLSFSIGILTGAVMAYRESTRLDSGGTLVSTFLTSIPYYLVAIVLLMGFAYQLRLFPTGGRFQSDLSVGWNAEFLFSVLHHGSLPIMSITLTAFGGWALGMRGNSISVLGKDYLRVARLAGIPERDIVVKYVTPNAILPLYTNLMIAIGGIFGGSIILEQIFNYPGLGYYIYESINARDYPLMMGGFIMITIAVVTTIFIADVTYSYIDPRAETGDSRETY
jgi:peptide/nickel transport system permease protein